MGHLAHCDRCGRALANGRQSKQKREARAAAGEPNLCGSCAASRRWERQAPFGEPGRPLERVIFHVTTDEWAMINAVAQPRKVSEWIHGVVKKALAEAERDGSRALLERLPPTSTQANVDRVVSHLRKFPRSSAKEICAALEFNEFEWKKVRAHLRDRVNVEGVRAQMVYSAKEDRCPAPPSL